MTSTVVHNWPPSLTDGTYTRVVDPPGYAYTTTTIFVGGEQLRDDSRVRLSAKKLPYFPLASRAPLPALEPAPAPHVVPVELDRAMRARWQR